MRLAAVQTEVNKRGLFGSFTLGENLHLTLIFLGELPETYVSPIRRAMDESVQDQKPFTLTADKLGAFNRGGKRIVWVGLGGSLQQLHIIYSQLENNLIAQGVLSQRQSYCPHITLAREVTTSAPIEELPLGTTLPFAFEVRAISLMESRREKGRLVYHRLSMAFLKQ